MKDQDDHRPEPVVPIVIAFMAPVLGYILVRFDKQLLSGDVHNYLITATTIMAAGLFGYLVYRFVYR